jgi:hypothetical protein
MTMKIAGLLLSAILLADLAAVWFERSLKTMAEIRKLCRLSEDRAVRRSIRQLCIAGLSAVVATASALHIFLECWKVVAEWQV